MIATRSSIAAAVRAAIRSSSFNSRFAKTVTGGVAVALSLGFGGVVHAQEAPAASATASGGAAVLEEVTVTGSRIRRTNDFTTPTPTTVIDSSVMQNMGIVNVGQALTMTPANISTFTPANTGNSSFFAGSYIADLRGLNPFFGSRTLTMVNTRRVVQTDQGDSVDLNFIPQILVSRVDTVTGGASAAYGSGAIAGVVNVILDNKLEGGKLDGDFYETSHSDNRDRHWGAAYGHGLFDDKLHFVVGGEYENQDALSCESVRSWCAQNQGFYQLGVSPAGVTYYGKGSNLRSNLISPYSVFTPSTTSTTTPTQALQATPDGTGVMPYSVAPQPYPGAAASNAVIGGDGTPIYQYTNLNAPVNRGVITGALTWALTDTVNFSSDVNWGKVKTTNYGGALTDTGDTISPQNAYIQNSPNLQAAVGPTGAAINKDWTSQVNQLTTTTTTVKRFSGGFDGKFGQSSWSWDAYAEYGLTEREQYLQDNRRLFSYAMAVDSVLVNGQPECRVTADGSVGAAIGDSLAHGGVFPIYGLADPTVAAALAQGCVPLNPFGNQPMSQAAHDYSFGPLDERLRYEQTVAAVDASGEYFQGIGAGPFTLAAGVEWRQEVGHNDEVACPAGSLSCRYSIDDFLIQYGEPFGGTVTVNEGFLETNLPLLKDKPFAKSFDIDLAGRESRYDNKALYGINVVNGVQPEFKHNLTTWKASMNWQTVDALRIRASQSRDARAANFRELYYGQVISPGGLFGYCGPNFTDPCQWNLEGNVNLRPETSDTTTAGFVFTPPSVTGLQFSADWFHIKIKNAIQQASVAFTENNCRANLPGACDGITFDNVAYGPNNLTGAAAYQAGFNNIKVLTSTSFNGAFYEVKGVDLSLNYLMSLPDGSTLNTRALATWMGEQEFQANPTAPVFDILGQTGVGNAFLADYQPTAKWRGSLALTWTKGPVSFTPSMNFVSKGIQDYLGVTPDNPLYSRVLAGDPTLAAYGYHAISDNHVPSYFLFNLNATYSLEDIGNFKEGQLFVQVNNVLNKTPPFTSGVGAFGVGNAYGGTNPVFFDSFGLAWRAGFRVRF